VIEIPTQWCWTPSLSVAYHTIAPSLLMMSMLVAQRAITGI
jgi:hypothetical protein